jgi:CHAD domain-containing protein
VAAVGPLSARVDVALAPDQRADAAAASVCRALAGVIDANIAGAIADADLEYLHQLRIAVRRTRTVARQLAGVFEPVVLPGFRAELKWLQQATGPARDLDVYVDELGSLARLLPKESRDDLEPLRPARERRRLEARSSMAGALRSRRTVDLLSDWEQLLESLVSAPLEDRTDAALPIGELAGRRVRHAYERAVHLGRGLDSSSPAESYHELRKRAKELRYLLELFGAVLPAEVVDGLIDPLKGLQDLLGSHQDREVQIQMLHALADEVGRLPGGGAACFAMGTLCERLAADKSELRSEFEKRFHELASGSRRRLVGAVLPE